MIPRSLEPEVRRRLVRDTGLLHALLEIESLHDLRGHPAVGGSFESLAVESLIAAAPALHPHHYRTARGDEVDLVLVRGSTPAMAIEVKLSTAPVVGAGFHRACADLGVAERYIVHPDADVDRYSLPNGAIVVGLSSLVAQLRRG